MIWFFQRDEARAEIETRFDNDTQEYVLVVRRPDASPTTERYPDAASFQVRLDALERDLESERWRSAGAPVILADGWPHKRPLR